MNPCFVTGPYQAPAGTRSDRKGDPKGILAVFWMRLLVHSEEHALFSCCVRWGLPASQLCFTFHGMWSSADDTVDMLDLDQGKDSLRWTLCDCRIHYGVAQGLLDSGLLCWRAVYNGCFTVVHRRNIVGAFGPVPLQAAAYCILYDGCWCLTLSRPGPGVLDDAMARCLRGLVHEVRSWFVISIRQILCCSYLLANEWCGVSWTVRPFLVLLHCGRSRRERVVACVLDQAAVRGLIFFDWLYLWTTPSRSLREHVCSCPRVMLCFLPATVLRVAS